MQDDEPNATPDSDRVVELYELVCENPTAARDSIDEIAIALLSSEGDTQRIAAKAVREISQSEPAVLDDIFNPIVSALESGSNIREITAEALARSRDSLPDDYYYHNYGRLCDILEKSDSLDTRAWILLSLTPVVGYGKEYTERPLLVVDDLLDASRWLPEIAALVYLREVAAYYPEEVKPYSETINELKDGASQSIEEACDGVLDTLSKSLSKSSS
ncbi:hypothetical protein [Salinibaculum rarum]|uniref:hypothetical protein n=1 Tax=Salinibaculum rarum TaxID=3058903 RepID=UPI00265DFEC7|nr:hypothetical protein [Salinibaculum sp. KK48]